MSDYGLVQQVYVEPKGSTLAADASTSDTTLLVDDAQDFDSDGGTLDLNGTRVAYTSITEGTNAEDPDTINLAGGLPVTASTDDAVSPVVGGFVPEDWYAVVSMGADGEEAHVPLAVDQRQQWPVGDYQDVPVTVSDDLQRILDAPGRTVSSRNSFRNTDTVTYSGSGDIAIPLTKSPISGSEQPFWMASDASVGGLGLPPGSWHIDGSNLIVDVGGIASGDLLWVDYAWDEALDDIQQTPETVPTPDIVIGESFEGGSLGDRVTAANAPGMATVLSGSSGIFVAEPHTGDQSCLVWSGMDGGASTGFSGTEDIPIEATQAGLYFKMISSGASDATATFNVSQHKYTGSGSDKIVAVTATASTMDLRVRSDAESYDEHFTLVPDVWYQMDLTTEGDWYVVSDVGGVATGNVGAMASNYRLATSVTDIGGFGSLAGNLVVDDFYYRPAPDVE